MQQIRREFSKLRPNHGKFHYRAKIGTSLKSTVYTEQSGVSVIQQKQMGYRNIVGTHFPPGDDVPSVWAPVEAKDPTEPRSEAGHEYLIIEIHDSQSLQSINTAAWVFDEKVCLRYLRVNMAEPSLSRLLIPSK